MTAIVSPRQWLRAILWVTCVHSALVGIGLILLPSPVLSVFGLRPFVEGFFPTQGGVFHIVMAIAYALAARSAGRNHSLLVFVISAKFIATGFPVAYYTIVTSAWILLLSAAGDGLLGLLILTAYRRAGNDIDREDENADDDHHTALDVEPPERTQNQGR